MYEVSATKSEFVDTCDPPMTHVSRFVLVEQQQPRFHCALSGRRAVATASRAQPADLATDRQASSKADAQELQP